MVWKAAPPWKVLFMGTDRFALPILEALCAEVKRSSLVSSGQLVSSVDVVTKRSQGVIHKYASNHPDNMKHFIWPDVEVSGGYDVGVVASFGHLIPKSFIDRFPHGILNVHPSLLPRWRGCAPVAYTIYAGDKITGVTIQKIRPYKYDVGPIVNQIEYAVPPNATSLQLLDILAAQGADLLLETLRDLAHREEIETDQDVRLATYASKINKRDSKLMIDWDRDSCDNIDRKFRAFGEMHDIRSYYGEYKVKLRKPLAKNEMQWYTLRDPKMVGHPGSVAYISQKDCLGIQCKDGLVGMREIAVKKVLSAKSFHNGYLSKPQWKYTKFSDTIQPDGPTKPTVMTIKKRMAHRRHWHLQLLRINNLPADG